MTSRTNLQNVPDSTSVSRRTVRFASGDAELVGTLFVPSGADGPMPAAVVAGAWTTVKEQMAGTYARELAGRGVAALAFDYTGWGESGGAPRFVEDPAQKSADLMAAVDFLATRPEVDDTRIAAVGVCASAGYAAAAAADHPKVQKLGLVAPWLHDATLVAAVYGGEEGVAALIDKGLTAGDANIIAASTTDDGALMFQAPYYTEPERGLIDAYDNRFALRSWRPWLTYDALDSAERLGVPMLVIGSDAMALPDGAKRYIARTHAPVQERWLDDISQFDFYDRADIVAQSADALAAHLRDGA